MLSVAKINVVVPAYLSWASVTKKKVIWDWHQAAWITDFMVEGAWKGKKRCKDSGSGSYSYSGSGSSCNAVFVSVSFSVLIPGSGSSCGCGSGCGSGSGSEYVSNSRVLLLM